MSGRHQPEHGADSAEGLAGLDVQRLAQAVHYSTWACPTGQVESNWCDPRRGELFHVAQAQNIADEYGRLASTHLRPDTTERLLNWIDRRLADVESELGDDETMKSRGLHGTAVLHERRDTLKFMRAQIEQDAA